jgi:hypothetical protein
VLCIVEALMLVQLIIGCWCRMIGIGCYKLLVQVDSDRLEVILFDLVIGFLHLAFIFQGSWMGKGKGDVSSFQLVPKNQGVGSLFRLEPEN